MAQDNVPTSSIVTKAIDAQTFNEMQAFVKDLEGRPLDRLLQDLPQLVKVSEAKSSIVAYVIASKTRHADEESRRSVVETLEAMHARFADGDGRERVSEILERVRREAR